MQVLDKLACALGRCDEWPNIELAEAIAESGDEAAVAELIQNLHNKQKAIRYDCIRVAYEIAERRPALISPFAEHLLALLQGKENRMTWGAMMATDYIALEKPDTIFEHIDALRKIAAAGSVITRDHFIGILAKLIKAGKKVLIPIFLGQLETCPSNQLAMYAERHFEAIEDENKKKMAAIHSGRLDELKTKSKRKRVEKVIKRLA